MPLLASNHTVIAPGLRGAGYFDCPHGGYDKATMAADIHEMMHAPGFERYAECGHDIDAIVALTVACNYRQAATHLAILDSAIPGWSKWEAILSDPRVWHFSFHMKENHPGMAAPRTRI
ncbi:alpha/beta fold hydrolase [Paraburkholderia sp. RL17-347-BIC-D]|uniref:alpha/beta fold hydrolase n=1 Tax=Paraburkholderia sp. RL17-347-BIC-D TaxID=3031632 RepID=UPI0038B6C658